jgi:hypothetical protein
MYYTGVKPSRHSQQLDYKAKGFEVENEPVKNMLQRWIEKKPVFNVMAREQPIYGSIVGDNGVSNEAVRNPIVGYNLIKKDPYTMKENVLGQDFSSYMNNEMRKKNKPIKEFRYGEESAEPEIKTPPIEPIPQPVSRKASIEFINNNANSINRFIQLQTDINGYYNYTKTIDAVKQNYINLTLKAITESFESGVLKMAITPVADEINKKKSERKAARQQVIANMTDTRKKQIAIAKAVAAETRAQAKIAKAAAKAGTRQQTRKNPTP